MEPITHFAQDRRIRGAVFLGLIVLVAFLFIQTVNSIKEFQFIGGGVPSSNVITVNGEGEVFAVPDIATFTFSVVEERASAAEAQNAAAEKTNRVIAFIRGEGVDEKDIKTTNFNLYPRYEFARFSGERTLAGFEVNQSVTIKVRDTARAGELVAGVSELGVSNVSGLSFTIDEEESLKREARTMAIDDARVKARELADDLGVRLVRVVSFSEFGEPVFFPQFDVAESRALGIGGSVAPELPAGENKITSQVSITYEIR